MVSVRASADIASRNGLNLTGSLEHADVVSLAETWLPHIFFHQDEKFHPIDLEDLFVIPKALIDSLPDAAQDPLRITVDTPTGPQRFNPPVVRDGNTIIVPITSIGTDPAVPVDSTEAMGEAADKSALYTHGDSYERSKQFFGASTSMSGLPEPAPGDPRVPRHTIKVRAEMRYLLETLHHELNERPIDDERDGDALWGRLDIADVFFPNIFPGNSLPSHLTGDAARNLLRDLVDGQMRGDDAAIAAAITAIPSGFGLNTRAWSAIRNYCFLEFYFFYAYNDFDEYGDWPFVNTHEGDVEGCCVVFEREQLDKWKSDPAQFPFETVIGHTVITSVHEEFNDSDELKRLPRDRQAALDDHEVFVAPGSHATYLTAGSHDFTDLEDIVTDWPGMLPWWAKLLAVLAALHPIGRIIIAVIILLVVAVEHFFGSEDETTKDGVVVGPRPDPQPGTTSVGKQIVVTPLSDIATGHNLYQAALPGVTPADFITLGALARRAYPGKWGGSTGTISHSSGWQNKTTRYFKKFLSNGEIEAPVIN